jgi:hypothetical protein
MEGDITAIRAVHGVASLEWTTGRGGAYQGVAVVAEIERNNPPKTRELAAAILLIDVGCVAGGNRSRIGVVASGQREVGLSAILQTVFLVFTDPIPTVGIVRVWVGHAVYIAVARFSIFTSPIPTALSAQTEGAA